MNCPKCGHKLTPSFLAQGMGKIGGSRTSRAKRKSSRENGKLGGRPKGKGEWEEAGQAESGSRS